LPRYYLTHFLIKFDEMGLSKSHLRVENVVLLQNVTSIQPMLTLVYGILHADFFRIIHL
jgi:hypothetical protein